MTAGVAVWLKKAGGRRQGAAGALNRWTDSSDSGAKSGVSERGDTG
ncbi:hypothetical protein [Paenibacillus tyrfis]|nr:hypothetical protein [Paenibacillus tyrfis]MCP1306635.1 hypothetical protein [Paenibacillus tyrfis]